MSTFVFVNVPAHGHVNPTLAVAKELIDRGEHVVYYLTEEFRTAVEATGATFRAYDSSLAGMAPPTEFASGNMAQNISSILPLRMVSESANVLPQVLSQIQADRPDVILYDMMCLWGRIVARSLRIAAVMLRPSYVAPGNMLNRAATSSTMRMPFSPELFGRVNRELAQLCQQYDVTPFGLQELFQGTEPLTVVFTPKEFQPVNTKPGDQFVFVGPSIQQRPDTTGFPLAKLDGRTVIFISLGTVFNNQAAFYNTCFAALKDSPWLVVLSYGTRIDPASLDSAPDNFIIAPTVPQLEVLQHASVFITHGGMNSTMESLYYGVPMVVVPQMFEQSMTASRVEELGLGIQLDKNELDAEKLRSAIEQVLNDDRYRTRVEEMRASVRAAGGYKVAADAITAYASAREKKGQP